MEKPEAAAGLTLREGEALVGRGGGSAEGETATWLVVCLALLCICSNALSYSNLNGAQGVWGRSGSALREEALHGGLGSQNCGFGSRLCPSAAE